MKPRISIVTLGTRNPARAYKFYKEGLGFPTGNKVDDPIFMFSLPGTLLAIYPYEKLREEARAPAMVNPEEFCGVTLAQNYENRETVLEILEKARQSGARQVIDPVERVWGGYSGYFQDPDGYWWEIASGAWEFNEDGSLKI